MEIYSNLYENFESWLSNKALGLSGKTLKQYLFVTKGLINFIKSFKISSLNEIHTHTFKKFIHVKPNSEPYSDASIRQRIAALDIFFAWAIESGVARLDSNPIVSYRKIKIQPRRLDSDLSKRDIFSDILTDDEQRKLIETKANSNPLSVRNYCIVLFILGTGLYVEEVSTLRNDAINLKKGYLIIKRGEKKERRVLIDLTICGKACEAWEKQRKNILGEKESPLYFINRNNAKIEPNRLYEIVATILKKNGIQKKHMGPDLLRQTAIYNLSRSGYSLEELKNITGIKTSRFLEKYKVITA